MKYILVVLSFAVLVGCAGKLYTIENPKPDASGRIKGVIVYQPKPMVFVIERPSPPMADLHHKVTCHRPVLLGIFVSARPGKETEKNIGAKCPFLSVVRGPAAVSLVKRKLSRLEEHP